MLLFGSWLCLGRISYKYVHSAKRVIRFCLDALGRLLEIEQRGKAITFVNDSVEGTILFLVSLVVFVMTIFHKQLANIMWREPVTRVSNLYAFRG